MATSDDERHAENTDSGRGLALVVLGGVEVGADQFGTIPPHLVVIAADSGVDQAHRLGLQVDVAIGDFDSVTAAGLDLAAQRGAQVHRHPVTKDATDFELALDAALALGVNGVAVLGGEGGRLDHLLANALLMASPRYESLDLTAHGSAGERVYVVRSSREIVGEPGELVTLLAVNGPAVGVTTTNLLYPLTGERLDPGSSRGVSNQLTATTATVSLRSGALLAVLPGATHVVADGNDPSHEGTPR